MLQVGTKGNGYDDKKQSRESTKKQEYGKSSRFMYVRI